MLGAIKRVLFDQLVWDVEFDGREFYRVKATLKVDDGYYAEASSRREKQALGYALRDIAEQMIARNNGR